MTTNDDGVVPSIRRQISLTEQRDLIRKLATRCEQQGGVIAAETVLIVNQEEGEVLNRCAATLEMIEPMAEEVRRLVWNEKQKGGRR